MPTSARSLMDRASDYGSEGWKFESSRARLKFHLAFTKRMHKNFHRPNLVETGLWTGAQLGKCRSVSLSMAITSLHNWKHSGQLDQPIVQP